MSDDGSAHRHQSSWMARMSCRASAFAGGALGTTTPEGPCGTKTGLLSGAVPNWAWSAVATRAAQSAGSWVGPASGSAVGVALPLGVADGLDDPVGELVVGSGSGVPHPARTSGMATTSAARPRTVRADMGSPCVTVVLRC